MKITKEEFENGPSAANAEPLGLFWQGIGAEAARTVYTRMLQRILCDIPEDVLDVTFEPRAAQFVRLGVPSGCRLCLVLLLWLPTVAARMPIVRVALETRPLFVWCLPDTERV